MADSITDSLTRDVIQDSVKAMGDVAEEKESKEKERLEKESQEKERREKESKEEEEKEQSSEVAAQNLLNEAITQMLGIRRGKIAKAQDKQEQEENKRKEEEEEERKKKNKEEFDRLDLSKVSLNRKPGSLEAEDILGVPKLTQQKNVIKQVCKAKILNSFSGCYRTVNV